MSNEPETERPLPHNPEAERALLGCCLLDSGPSLNLAVGANLRPESFFLAPHAIVFAALCDLLAAGKPIEAAILANQLKLTGRLEAAGGYGLLGQLAGSVPTSAHAAYWIEQVRVAAQLRQVIERSQRLIAACLNFEGDLGAEIAPRVEQVVAALQPPREDRTWARAVDEAEAATRDRMKPKAQRSKSAGLEISWGIPDFDRVFQPLERGEEVIIGGYTSAGKSSLLRQILWAMSKAGESVALETIEVRDSEEAINLAAHISGIRSRARLDELHRFDQEKLLQAFAAMKIENFAVFHEDHSMSAMIARAKAVKRRRGLTALGADYLQIMEDVKNLRPGIRPDFAIGQVTSGFKRFATAENVIVFLLSGFNRDYIKGDGRAPRLSDLEGSSSIEKDASRVLLIDVPSEYTLGGQRHFQDVSADSEKTPRFFVSINQAKGRNQGTAKVPMWFKRETKTFEPISLAKEPGLL